MKTIAIVSGGMDSVTLAYYAKEYLAPNEGELYLLSVDYGQRHKKELEYARICAHALGATHRIADLSSLNALLSGSSLTDNNCDVPEGHYAEPTMRLTVVPNRNAIMLSIATGWAVALGAGLVLTGVHAGDHPVYPDCRPEFIEAFNTMAEKATDGFAVEGFGVEAPFSDITKAEIATLGYELGVPFDQTWSCYKGDQIHCAKCGTCYERIESFALAGVDDPTEYEDKEAVTAIREALPA